MLLKVKQVKALEPLDRETANSAKE